MWSSDGLAEAKLEQSPDWIRKQRSDSVRWHKFGFKQQNSTPTCKSLSLCPKAGIHVAALIVVSKSQIKMDFQIKGGYSDELFQRLMTNVDSWSFFLWRVTQPVSFSFEPLV